MFSKIFTSLLLVSAMTAGAFSKPIPKNRMSRRGGSSSQSFNHWGGFSSMDNFDNFYGSGNFDGSQHFSQTIVHENQLVCHTQQVEIIQQRLLVIQEMAKRVVTELVCDVETQTIVFEQFHSSLGGFSHDLSRSSGHQVGYDSSIVSHFGNFYNHDGSLNVDDWGFSGHDLGSHTVVVGGSNWVDSSSPVSVSNAYSAAHGAYLSLHPELSGSDVSRSSSSVPVNFVPPSVAPSDVSDAVPTDVSDAVPTDVSDAVPTDGSVPVDPSTAAPVDSSAAGASATANTSAASTPATTA